jgi:GT2 family glycosyltransferase
VAGSPLVTVVSAIDDHHARDPSEFLEALSDQSVPRENYELVIVDHHGLAGWREACERVLSGAGAPQIRFELRKGVGRAGALNRCLELARADLIVFLADDFLVGSDFVEAHLRFHREHPEREAVGIGRAMFPPRVLENEFSAWLERTGRLFGVRLDEACTSVPSDYFYVGNASVKRALIDLVGPFDEDFPYHACDDYEYGLRLAEAGMQSSLVEGADVLHDHDVTLRERWRQMGQAGESATLLSRKLPGPHPGLREGDVSPWRWAGAGLKWWLWYLVTRRDEYKERYFDRILLAPYSSGIRRARGAFDR